MIFADKLIELRKKAGMTQEDLADKMNVTRQAIAKWEGMQSVPELNKIIELSKIFEVSIDYLLKDELENKQPVESKIKEETFKSVSMEESSDFLRITAKSSSPMAIAVLLCIFSPITLILLSAFSQVTSLNISTGLAVGVGLGVLLIFVAIAVGIFISIYNKNTKYRYLGEQIFDIQNGVYDMVNSKKNNYKPIYDRCNLIGVLTCILSIIPFLVGILIDMENVILVLSTLCGMIVLIGVAVFLFVKVGVVWGSYQKLLQDGEYSKEKKQEQKSVIGVISNAYWLIIVTVYIIISFTTKMWELTWIVWAVAGILYPVLIAILRAKRKKNKDK